MRYCRFRTKQNDGGIPSLSVLTKTNTRSCLTVTSLFSNNASKTKRVAVADEVEVVAHRLFSIVIESGS